MKKLSKVEAEKKKLVCLRCVHNLGCRKTVSECKSFQVRDALCDDGSVGDSVLLRVKGRLRFVKLRISALVAQRKVIEKELFALRGEKEQLEYDVTQMNIDRTKNVNSSVLEVERLQRQKRMAGLK